METNQSINILDRFNQWLKESITIKLLSIGFLMLILLIPTGWIESLITERQQRAESVIAEISEKWSGNQTVSGPILVIPYKYKEIIFTDREKTKTEIKESYRKAFFLPEQLEITCSVTPEIRHRGIFDAVVYNSSLGTNAVFIKPDFKKMDIDPATIQWQEVHCAVAISDLRGISENPMIKNGAVKLDAEPSQNIGIVTNELKSESTGIIIPLNWQSEGDFNGQVDIHFGLKGSSQLSFVPSGKTTTAKLSGPWATPSFDGEFLPTSHSITDAGFTAEWKILHFNRPFSQQWKDDHAKLTGSEFGLKMILPVDQYQKSIRTSKYALLIILLTFISLFLVEITNKIRIHPFQYILIGAALTIYYTLLLSFSEQVGYNIGYWISTIATIALISLYSLSLFQRKGLTVLFTVLLIIFYVFIFIIILQQDFSLLIGSTGLFLIVGALMYFSRKINWYKDVTE